MESKQETRAVWDGSDGPTRETASVPEGETPSPPAWEMLYEGAYMPRRVRGSWRGGVLG
ncbi:hypothetical protein HRbin11_00318 [bacterium HR11]|nr:hypothetical protein HRbin11_00318 [bacterium HR11]